MDLSFSGTDATAENSPMEFWLNNNYDRWDYDLLGLTNEQDDVLPGAALQHQVFNQPGAADDRGAIPSRAPVTNVRYCAE